MAAAAKIVKSNEVDNLDPSTIQHIPCKLSYTGPANVSNYFILEEKENGTQTASFRGRGLEGSVTSVPEGHKLYVAKKRVERDGSTVFSVVAESTGFTGWEWDRQSGSKSTVSRAFEYIQLANVLASDD